jgi:large subunit ribosomal protein L13
MVKTFSPNKSTVDRKWYLLDLDGLVLGRAASAIAHVLIGKHKADYAPHVDNGDFVIAINASKIKYTGQKYTDKIYWRHSNYPGGIKSRTLEEMLDRDPRRVIELAVKNMLPKNRLGRALLSKLKVYSDGGPSHKFDAQKPEDFPKYILERRKSEGKNE